MFLKKLDMRINFILFFLFYLTNISANQSEKVIIIGGGIGGSVSALELSNHLKKVVILEKNKLMSRTSVLNPGRNAHGFHYTDLSTCKEMLIGSMSFEDYFPNHRRNSKGGWYLVVENSQVSAEEYLAVCNYIKEVYRSIRSQYQTDFGDPETFYETLSIDEYKQFVVSNFVSLGIKTHEYNIDIEKLQKTIKKRLKSNKNIVVKEHCKVFDVVKNNDEYEVFYSDGQHNIRSEKSSIVINASWEHRQHIDSFIGVYPEKLYTNRLKVLALVKLPKELENAPSIMFVRGPFCMFSNKGNGQGFLTYAPITNSEESQSIIFPEKWEKEITYQGHMTKELQELGQKIIQGVSRYIPSMKNAQLIEVRKGIVTAPGDGDIYRKDSAIHKRDASGVYELAPGWYSLDTGKLILAPIHAKTLVEIMNLTSPNKKTALEMDNYSTQNSISSISQLIN